MSSLLINDLDFLQSFGCVERNSIKGGIATLFNPANLSVQILGIGYLLGVDLPSGMPVNLQPRVSVVVGSAATSSSSGYGISATAMVTTAAGEGGASYYLSTSISL